MPRLPTPFLLPLALLLPACVPAPQRAIPAPVAITGGDVDRFGPGLIESRPAGVTFHLQRTAFVRLVDVRDGYARALPSSSGSRRAAGTHEAMVQRQWQWGTNVVFRRTNGTPTAPEPGVHAAEVLPQEPGECNAMRAFASQSYAVQSRRDSVAHGNDATSPVTLDLRPQVARICNERRPQPGSATGVAAAPDAVPASGYWLLIASDAPLNLSILDARLDSSEWRSLTAEELVQALPAALLAGAARQSWAAYALPR